MYVDAAGMLQNLEVPYNCLEGALPETLGLIRSLRVLDVSFNKVNALPNSIIALDKVCMRSSPVPFNQKSNPRHSRMHTRDLRPSMIIVSDET